MYLSILSSGRDSDRDRTLLHRRVGRVSKKDRRDWRRGKSPSLETCQNARVDARGARRDLRRIYFPFLRRISHRNGGKVSWEKREKKSRHEEILFDSQKEESRLVTTVLEKKTLQSRAPRFQ